MELCGHFAHILFLKMQCVLIQWTEELSAHVQANQNNLNNLTYYYITSNKI